MKIYMHCIIYHYEHSYPKGLRAESARDGAPTLGTGEGEDFLPGRPFFFTKTAVTPEQKVEKSFPRWEIKGGMRKIKMEI